MTIALHHALVTEAALAPSVHNIQPARWRFGDDGWLTCFHVLARSLPHGDPTGRDARLSIGAAVEGMAIAAGRHGLALEVHAWGPDAGDAGSPAGMRAVARLRLTPNGSADPLGEAVYARRSWRGRFTGDATAALSRVYHDDLLMIRRSDIPAVARWHDGATWHFERRREYHAELWRWLRLSPRHPDWKRDGLNADALVLSPIERAAAAILLRPRVFAGLGRIGVARLLVSESTAVRSAAGLLVFAPPASLDDWTVGRRFYRAWLTATQAGLALAPMSALADLDITRARVAERARVPADRRVVNVFRAGLAPAGAMPERARLPASELLV